MNSKGLLARSVKESETCKKLKGIKRKLILKEVKRKVLKENKAKSDSSTE